MINDIKHKLRLELEKKIKEETQVVYILSRVRKILEIDKKEKKYSKLKFYCDWALHAQIDNVGPMETILKDFISMGPLDEKDFLGFKPLEEELKLFLAEYNMPTKIYDIRENATQFRRLLTLVYSDTPLVIKTIKKTKITIKEQIVGDFAGTGFEIKETD